MGAALPVFVLTGPTGVGKSDWAIRLAREAPVEIVSVGPERTQTLVEV